MRAAIIKCWVFLSSSGSGKYQTLKYSDGSTSCDCRGWTQRVAANGSRSCKHTRAVDCGTADVECESFHDYEGQTSKWADGTTSEYSKPTKSNATKTKENFNVGLGERKFFLK
jgi:hypothetical protein